MLFTDNEKVILPPTSKALVGSHDKDKFVWLHVPDHVPFQLPVCAFVVEHIKGKLKHIRSNNAVEIQRKRRWGGLAVTAFEFIGMNSPFVL